MRTAAGRVQVPSFAREIHIYVYCTIHRGVTLNSSHGRPRWSVDQKIGLAQEQRNKRALELQLENPFHVVCRDTGAAGV